MKRRDFLKLLGYGVAGVAAAPALASGLFLPGPEALPEITDLGTLKFPELLDKRFEAIFAQNYCLTDSNQWFLASGPGWAPPWTDEDPEGAVEGRIIVPEGEWRYVS